MQSVTFPPYIEEGKILRWLKREGDPVKQDESLVEIETDKINTLLDATASGVVLQILVREGETAYAGEDLALIGEVDEDVPTPNPPFRMSPIPTSLAPKKGLFFRLFTRKKSSVTAQSLSALPGIRKKDSGEVQVIQDSLQTPSPPEPTDGAG